MKKHKVRVIVTLKEGVLDPQGLAIKHVIDGMEKKGFEDVRQGKVFDLVISAKSAPSALAAAKEVAGEVLSNPLLETFECIMEK
ncbi:MAG: phosphoribosylformylglycinamidine synthase subunit PurS [Acidobacteriota bacterium]